MRLALAASLCLVPLAASADSGDHRAPPELAVQTAVRQLGCVGAVSGDGRLLAHACGESVALWDLGSGLQIRVFRIGSTRPTVAVDFGARGVRTCGSDGTREWSTVTGELLGWEGALTCQTDTGNPTNHHELKSPDGKWLAVSERDVLILTDTATGKNIRELQRLGKGNVAAKSLAFTPDSKVLVSDFEFPTLFSVETGATLKTLLGASAYIRSAEFSHDGARLIVHTLYLTDAERRTSQTRIFDLASARQVAATQVDDDARLAHSSKASLTARHLKGTLTLEDAAGKALWSHPEPRAFERLVFSPDGSKIAAWSIPTTVRVFSTATGELVSSFEIVEQQMTGHGNSIAWSADGKRLAAAGNALAVYDAASGKPLYVKILEVPDQFVKALAFDRRGRLWSGGFGDLTLTTPVIGPPTAEEWDTRLKDALRKRSSNAVNSIQASPDGKTMASANSDGTIRLWALEGSTLETLSGHVGEVLTIAFSPDGKRLVSVGLEDKSVRIWDVEKKKLVATLVTVREDDYVLATPEGYYTSSRGGGVGMAFRYGDRAVPFAQLDLRFNRPDKVVEALGMGKPRVVEAYRHAYERRLRKLGLTEASLADDARLPVVKVVPSIRAISTPERTVSLHVTASDALRPLRRLHVVVNGVPMFGTAGADATTAAGTQLARDVTVDLSSGGNRIEVSVTNDAGAESLREVLELACASAPETDDLYVLAIGVSEYANKSYSLQYAAKDASDVARQLAGTVGSGKAHVVTLLDGQVTREKIREARALFEKARVDDRVIVFVAGHGLLDDKLDYYFGTADIDFAKPAARGLPYEDLAGLLDAIRSRRKLLLVDTCNSGELDKSEVQQAVSRTLPEGTVKARAVRGIKTVARSGLGASDTLGLLQDLFADVSRGSGAAVISSSGGMEFALESDEWKNGVFTYSLLAGLRKGAADRNLDGLIAVSELRDWVVKHVVQLTGGRQRPTARQENAEHDFTVATTR